QTVAANLALACVSCSLRKAARQTAIDPQSGQEATLFNPRRDTWHGHFRWEGVHLVGLTATGRATISALNMNRALILAIRQEETALGRHPQS
ncbi:MAG: HNH endonuclease, partial [Candidatus Binatia bacterium]